MKAIVCLGGPRDDDSLNAPRTWETRLHGVSTSFMPMAFTLLTGMGISSVKFQSFENQKWESRKAVWSCKHLDHCRLTGIWEEAAVTTTSCKVETKDIPTASAAPRECYLKLAWGQSYECTNISLDNLSPLECCCSGTLRHCGTRWGDGGSDAGLLEGLGLGGTCT